MKTHSLSTRVLSLFLTLVMVLGVFPAAAFAAEPAVVPATFVPVSGTAVPEGYSIDIMAAQGAKVYYVVNDDKATTAEYIKANGSTGISAIPNIAVATVNGPTTVKAVYEQDGVLSEINTAEYTIREPLADGKYTMNFTCHYYMLDEFMYSVPASKPSKMLVGPATVEIKDGQMTVTIPTKDDGGEYPTELSYRLKSEQDMKLMTLKDADEDGIPDSASFTMAHSELPLVANVKYGNSGDYPFGLSLDFANAKKEVTSAPATFVPAAGSAVPEGYKINIMASQGAEVYYVVNDDKATTPEYIKANGTQGIKGMGIAVVPVNGETTVKAVYEKDGVMSDINTATYTIREPLADGKYTMNLSCHYYMFDSFLYKFPASKPAKMLVSPADVEIKNGQMTVTISTKDDGGEYPTELAYRLESEKDMKLMTLKDADEDGIPDSASFTMTHSELPLVANVKYGMSGDYPFAISLDFANAKKEGGTEPTPNPEPAVPGIPEGYTYVGTCKADIGNMKCGYITAGNGKHYRPKQLIKIPNQNPDYGRIPDMGLMDQIPQEEMPLLEKDGKYYIQFRIQLDYPQYNMEYIYKQINHVAIDLNNLEAPQTNTPLDIKVVTVDGLKYAEVLFGLGTKDEMTEPKFYWLERRAKQNGVELPKGGYETFAVCYRPSYTITADQTMKMPADGEYLANYTLALEGLQQSKYGSKLANTEKQVPITVKDGKATILVEAVGFTAGEYAIYGKGTVNNIIPTPVIPVESTGNAYVYLETDDLRKVIAVGSGGASEWGHFYQAIRIDMDTLVENPNAPEKFNLLEDSLYLADIELTDEQGNAIELPFPNTEGLKARSKTGLITVVVPYDEKADPTGFKWRRYGEYCDTQWDIKVDTKNHTVEFKLFHMDDVGHYAVTVGGVEKQFQVKLRSVENRPVDCGLEDGNYIIDIDTLKETSDDESMSGNFITKTNVPVRVENGAMYMTLDVKTTDKQTGMSDLITGFKHEFNGKWRVDDFAVTDPAKYGDGEERITTEIRIDNLTQPTFVSIYVTAMGSWPVLRIVPKMDTLRTVTADDQEKAATVTAQIKAIGTVTLESQQVIADARKAYDALTDVQKALVRNLPALTAAEGKLDHLAKPVFEDGNYYVNFALWHESKDQASMGDAAFAENRKALVTVKNGKVTDVQICSAPVKKGTFVSGITEVKIDGKNVTVLKSAKLTTEPAKNEINYIQLFSFQMPEAAQPDESKGITYIPVQFKVPDTPMGENFMNARLKMEWTTAAKTEDTEIAVPEVPAVPDAPAVDTEDKDTGIKVHADKNVFTENVTLVVDPIVKGENDYDSASKALAKKGSKFQIFEVHFENDAKKEVQPNGLVTVSYKIPEGYDAAKVQLYRVNDDDTLTLIRGEVKDGYFVTAQKSFSVYALVDTTSAEPDPTTPETSVPETTDPENKPHPKPQPKPEVPEYTDIAGHWGEEYIRFASQYGLFNGMTETTFAPEVSMTRGMFVTVLGRLYGADGKASGKTHFTDVPEDAYFAPYVAWAIKAGITNGTSEDTFSPESNVTRQEMATFLSRYCKFAGITLKDGEKVTYADADEMDGWAVDSIDAVSRAGLLQGMGDNVFAPKSSATRAQVATLLTRFLKDYIL